MFAESLVKQKFKMLAAVAVLLVLPFFSLPLAALAETKEELEIRLKNIEQQINDLQSQLSRTTTEKNTIAGKVKELKNQQAQLSLQIQSTNYLISDLGDKIAQTRDAVLDSEIRIERLKLQISETLIELYQKDNTSLVGAIAASGGLTGFFQEVDNVQKLSQSLAVNLEGMRRLKADLELQQRELSDREQSAQGLLALKAAQQRDLNGKLKDQTVLLDDAKGKEAQQTVILNYNKQIAAQIRGQIYELLGISTEVTFGQALDIAKTVSASIGVRPAFLLAVLTQESNLGKNTGTCNRPGDPPEKSWRVIMKPDRDQAPFQQITSELALDIETTPVSCPMRSSKGARIGWGGAMGPAQFIPSTWLGYKDRVAQLTGKPAANPFDIRDAFYAAGLKLKAGGAGSQEEQGEWNAAMRYFSGSTNKRYRFYGDSVLTIARKYQSEIDTLGN